MLSYVKFVKKIWANKKKLGEFETVALIEESSAIIQKKLLPKLTDPKSFNTPCYIGNGSFGKALCEHVHVCVLLCKGRNERSAESERNKRKTE